MDGRCVNSQWHKRVSEWYVWTWSKPQRQEGAKGPFESFSSRVTLKCHSGRFPHPHCWIHHYSGFVLDGHFHYKGRNRTREEFWWSGCHRRGILGLLVHHSLWDYILGMENSCLACTSHMSILQVDKVELERRRVGGWWLNEMLFGLVCSVGLRVNCVGQIEKRPEGSPAVRLTLSLPFFRTT